MASYNYTGFAGSSASAPDSNNTEAVALIGIPSGSTTVHFAVTSSRGSATGSENGIAVYLVDESTAGTATINSSPTSTLSDADANTTLDDVVDLASVTVGSNGYVFALSNSDNSIQALSIDSAGTITNAGNIDLGPLAGGSFDPSSMDLVIDGNSVYLITAGVDRLHAVEFDTSTGQFINGTASQALANITNGGYWGGYPNGSPDPNSFVETANIGGTDFVIAGGGDGNSGISLFTFDSVGGLSFETRLDAVTDGLPGLTNLRAADMVELNGRIFIIAGGDSSSTAGQDTISVIEVTGNGPYTLTSVFETGGLFDSINDIEIVANPNGTGFDVLIGQDGQSGIQIMWLGIDANSGAVSLTQGLDDITNTETAGNVPNVTSIASLDGIVFAGSSSNSTSSLVSAMNFIPFGGNYCFVGENNADGLGADVDGGDFDGDGYSDILIGAAFPTFAPNTTFEGKVYVVSAADLDAIDLADGNRDGQIAAANIAGVGNSYEISGINGGDGFGHAVEFIGDIDGDGRSDIAIGAPFYDEAGRNNAGEMYILSTQDFDTLDNLDGNRDGEIDLSLANFGALSNSYKLSWETSPAASPSQAAGYHLESMEDWDGDGRSELIIGAYGISPNGFRSGTVFIASSSDWAAADALDGADGDIDLENLILVTNSSSYQLFGSGAERLGEFAADSVADVDGDNRADIFVGANSILTPSAPGSAYFIASSDLENLDVAGGAADDNRIDVADIFQSTTTPNSYLLQGNSAGDQAGNVTIGIDNFTGSGETALITSAPNAGAGGEVYILSADELANADAADLTVDQRIFLGSVADQSNSFEIVASTGYENLGQSLSETGDIDGDGRNELLIGHRTGVLLVSSGDLIDADTFDGLDGTINTVSLTSHANSQSYNFIITGGSNQLITVSSAGDVDNDGIDDFLIGFERGGGGSKGATFLVRSSQLEALDTANGGADDNIVNLNPHLGFVCFARGTLIETAEGPVPVEALKEDDLVTTMDDGLQPIKWIGSRTVSGRGALAPICIQKGALGNSKTLYVSPQHRMLVKGQAAELLFGEDDVLATAQSLVSGDMIYRAPCDQVEYFHVMLDKHQIIYANGVPTESFKPGEQGFRTFSEETQKELFAIFPELAYDYDSYGKPARTELKHFEGQLLAQELFAA